MCGLWIQAPRFTSKVIVYSLHDVGEIQSSVGVCRTGSGRLSGTKICRCSAPSCLNAVWIPPPCHTCGLHIHGFHQLWSDSGLADPQMQNLQVWREDSISYSLGFSFRIYRGVVDSVRIYVKGRKRDRNIKNRLLDTVREGEGGMI